ncbi:hypothetical protein BGZ98_009535 [Dissophora globulifera]|nr:hypothetical protein BGZ98_009535 [Dissophora globulifera]
MNADMATRNAQQDGANSLGESIEDRTFTRPSAIIRPRTRHVLQSVINAPLDVNATRPRVAPQPNSFNQSIKKPTAIPVSALYNKTWIMYKTTPLYAYNSSQYATYETELLTYIAANAKNLSSSVLTEQTQDGLSTFAGENRRFPSQIDSSGRNVIETLDDPGDIKSVDFQQLNLQDTANLDASESELANSHPSLVITITVRPKGKTREQPYYCVLVQNQPLTHESRPSSVFEYFNLVLLKAPVVVGQLVMQWLERKFDCRICRLLLQSYELRKVVNSSLEAMYNHPEGQEDRKSRSIELHYSFPEAVSTLDSISISLPSEDARQLLVSRSQGSEAGLLDGVEAHCSDSMKIDFGRLSLVRAGCSSWYIASEGKVKLTNNP